MRCPLTDVAACLEHVSTAILRSLALFRSRILNSLMILLVGAKSSRRLLLRSIRIKTDFTFQDGAWSEWGARGILMKR